GAMTEAVETMIPLEIAEQFAITQEIWSSLGLELQKQLANITQELKSTENNYYNIRHEYEQILMDADADADLTAVAAQYGDAWTQAQNTIDSLRKQGETIIFSVTPKMETPEDKFTKYSKTLQELGKTLKEAYRFSIY